VYTDTPATRSPLLTVLLAIVILAVLTAAALAALYWFQRRAENLTVPEELYVMNAAALKQTHSSMYNDLTPATDDLGLQETDQKALLQ
jgi:type II secretory pathway pseudopilin PulG